METSHDFFPVKERIKAQFSENELTQIFHQSVLNNARVDKYGGMVISFEFLSCYVTVYRNFESTQYM